MAYDADPVSGVECVMQEPFEGAPGRVHLDRALEPPVVSNANIGVTSSHMRDHDGIFAIERAEEVTGSVAVARAPALRIDEDAGRSADRAPFVAEKDVPIATHAGVARPFVSRHTDELARTVERRREPVQFRPERVGDLEIVSALGALAPLCLAATAWGAAAIV